MQDLLKPANENLQIREGSNGVFVSGVEEQPVGSMHDCLRLMQLGDRNRQDLAWWQSGRRKHNLCPLHKEMWGRIWGKAVNHAAHEIKQVKQEHRAILTKKVLKCQSGFTTLKGDRN